MSILIAAARAREEQKTGGQCLLMTKCLQDMNLNESTILRLKEGKVQEKRGTLTLCCSLQEIIGFLADFL